MNIIRRRKPRPWQPLAQRPALPQNFPLPDFRHPLGFLLRSALPFHYERPENAEEFLEAGASHVIVTSYVFREGMIHYGSLERLCTAVGKEHLVLDLSCRKRADSYYIVTDRWQNFTEERIEVPLLSDTFSFIMKLFLPLIISVVIWFVNARRKSSQTPTPLQTNPRRFLLRPV